MQILCSYLDFLLIVFQALAYWFEFRNELFQKGTWIWNARSEIDSIFKIEVEGQGMGN